MKSKYEKINVSGLNLTNFINILIQHDINIQNLVRVNPSEIEFELYDRDLYKFNKLDKSKWQVKKISSGFKNRILHFLLYRMGLIIGIVLSLSAIVFFQNRLLNINITGLDRIEKTVVIEKLQEYGLKKYDRMDFDKKELENYLTKNLNLSFVSIKTQGNTLIINAKEELEDINNSYVPITADYNMVVTQINVYSGTSSVKAGDVMYAGDVLVEPYEMVNGEKIDVAPCAEIKGDIYFCKSFSFNSEEIITQKTGNTKVISVKYTLGNIKLFEKTYENSYESYELIETETLLTSYFLPIKITKIIAVETTTNKILHNFDEEKDEIVSKIRDEAYASVPEGVTIDNEDLQISSTKSGKYVTIYLKSSVYLKYNK